MQLQTRYLVVDPETILEHADLKIRDNTIASIDTRPLASDIPDTVILPGLVNAHVHVEFSAMHGRTRPTRCFDRWISQMIRIRQQWTPRDWTRSAQMGLQRLARNGITTIGDICKRTFLLPLFHRDPLRKVVFAETYHPDSEQADVQGRELEDIVRNSRPSSTFTLGITPHAPYTVSPKLYGQCLKIAKRHRIPVAGHVSETIDEIEFVQTGKGPLSTLIRRAGWPLPFQHPPAVTPVQYMEKLGLLKQGMVLIHGNYLTRADIALLARRSTPVVFCPGSHQFFRHDPHPVRALLRHGVPVALGTDSLASNDDLSILREMSLVRKHYRLDPRIILKMATRNGARALFGKLKLGELRPGWLADCTLLRIPRDVRKRDLLEYVSSEQPRVAATIVNGKVAYPSDRTGPRMDFFSD